MYITRLVQSSSDHRSSGLHLYYLLAPSWACYYHQLVETEKGLYSSLSSADVHIRNVSDSMIRKSLPHLDSGVCSGFPSRQTQGATRISCKGAATMIISKQTIRGAQLLGRLSTRQQELRANGRSFDRQTRCIPVL